MSDPDRERLARLLDLIAREDAHLLAVRNRLLGDNCHVDANRVSSLLSEDIGIDRLESFGAKFGRMQDTIVDKLIPILLRVAGERPAAAIDNLNRLEKLGLVSSADSWLQMRRLRNRLVHEYFDRPEDMAPALERACRFTDEMHSDYETIRDYAKNHLGIEAST